VERAGLDRPTKSGENVEKVFSCQTLRWSVWDAKRFASAGEMPPLEKLALQERLQEWQGKRGNFAERQNRPRDRAVKRCEGARAADAPSFAEQDKRPA